MLPVYLFSGGIPADTRDSWVAMQSDVDEPQNSEKAKRAQTFVRFGKRAQMFVRFGKRAQTFVRFGRGTRVINSGWFKSIFRCARDGTKTAIGAESELKGIWQTLDATSHVSFV